MQLLYFFNYHAYYSVSPQVIMSFYSSFAYYCFLYCKNVFQFLFILLLTALFKSFPIVHKCKQFFFFNDAFQKHKCSNFNSYLCPSNQFTKKITYPFNKNTNILYSEAYAIQYFFFWQNKANLQDWFKYDLRVRLRFKYSQYSWFIWD